VRRLSAALILVTLVLPYASAPLCAAAAHEHSGHAGHQATHAFVSAGNDAMGGVGCHALMACELTIQAPHVIPETPPTVVPRMLEAREYRPIGRPTPVRVPRAPPPRPV
jgi:hypothetical protein